MFDPREEALDQISRLVQVRIVESGFLAIGTRGDDRLDATGLDPLDRGVSVVALVGEGRIGTLSIRGGTHTGALLSGRTHRQSRPEFERAERYAESNKLRCFAHYLAVRKCEQAITALEELVWPLCVYQCTPHMAGLHSRE